MSPKLRLALLAVPLAFFHFSATALTAPDPPEELRAADGDTEPVGTNGVVEIGVPGRDGLEEDAVGAASAHDRSTPPASDSKMPGDSVDTMAGPEREREPLGRDAGLFGLGSSGGTLGDPLGEAESGLAASLSVPDVVKTFGGLAIVLGVLFILVWFLKRFSGPLARGGRPVGVLEVLARYPIGRGRQLVLLKLARRVVLVHQTGSAMTTLTEVTDEEEVAALLARVEAGSRNPTGRRFRDLLTGANAAYEGAGTTSPVPPSATRPESGIETIDLTRTQGRGLGRRRLTA